MSFSRNRAVLPLFALALCGGLQPVSAQSGKVLLVAKDGTSADLEWMLTQEVGVMKGMLEEAGFQVVIASPSAQPLVGTETTVTPELKLADVDMADFAGIIMPCMAMEEEAEVPELEALLKTAVATGKPVAAQLGSVVQLARAGLLQGKKFAYAKEYLPTASELADLDYGGQGVVDEGTVITGGVCPWAARDLGIEDTTRPLTKALIGKLTVG
jgi:putative intracellular protease/amidase